jgi:nicotinamidase-related amidase
MKVELLIIDPQNSFCDPQGSLYVDGAKEDMRRVSAMIKRLGSKIDAINVTLDSHRIIDVAHPAYWKNSDGKHPDPFTIISVEDVENGVWTTAKVGLYKKGLAYVKALESNGRYPLCIWPPHTLIGSQGHNVVKDLHDVLVEWESKNFKIVNYVTKGSNPHTEHYSIVRADVIDPEDPSTQINTQLVETLEKADIIVVCGEAGSHCVKNSILDIINSFNDEDCVKKMVVLEDGMSPVANYEHEQEDLFKIIKSKGVKFSTCEDFLK